MIASYVNIITPSFTTQMWCHGGRLWHGGASVSISTAACKPWYLAPHHETLQPENNSASVQRCSISLCHSLPVDQYYTWRAITAETEESGSEAGILLLLPRKLNVFHSFFFFGWFVSTITQKAVDDCVTKISRVGTESNTGVINFWNASKIQEFLDSLLLWDGANSHILRPFRSEIRKTDGSRLDVQENIKNWAESRHSIIAWCGISGLEGGMQPRTAWWFHWRRESTAQELLHVCKTTDN